MSLQNYDAFDIRLKERYDTCGDGFFALVVEVCEGKEREAQHCLAGLLQIRYVSLILFQKFIVISILTFFFSFLFFLELRT